jgi:putative ABC transport system permease protein
VWRRAPFVLVRYPGLLAALALGALLLAVAFAAYPLFLSATSTSLLRAELSAPLAGRYRAGISYKASNVPFAEPAPAPFGGTRYQALDHAFRDLAGEHELLGPPVFGILGPRVTVAPPDDRATPTSGRLLASTDALGHVQQLEGRPGQGAWLPDLAADSIRVGAGDVVSLQGVGGASVELPVDGVYRGLYSGPRVGYWQQWTDEIYPTRGSFADPAVPPQPILLDHDLLIRISQELGVDSATIGWQAPVRAGVELTVDRAREVSRFAQDVRLRISGSSAIGRLFDCCHERLLDQQQDTRFSTRIDELLAAAGERTAAVETPSRVLQVAGLLVAVAVVAAAGAFAVAARGTESRLLFARGMSPARFAARSAIESILPTVAGAILGFGFSILLVRLLGPGGAIAPSAVSAAAVATAAGAVIAVLALAVVSAASYVGRFEHRGGGLSVLARAPWELAALAVAVYSFRQLQSGAALVTTGDIRRPGVFLLAFPLALIAGTAGLGARAVRAGFERLRQRSGRFRASAYLAVHRLAAGSMLTVILLSAAGLSLGVFVQAQTLVRSLRRTVEANAHVFVGSDVRVLVDADRPVPGGVPFPITRVTRVAHAGTFTRSGLEYDLLAVDPGSFAGAAYWSESFSRAPLQEMVAALGDEGGGLPVILVGGVASGVSGIDINGEDLSIRVVGHADAFPGMLGRRPMVVVDGEALDAAYRGPADPRSGSDASWELWVRGPSRLVVGALIRSGFVPGQILTADRVEDIPYITATIATFVVLNALGLAAAVLVVVGLLMYLEARRRSQLVAYGLSLRMGMTEAGHQRSITLELGTMLLGALVVGAGIGLAAAFVISRFLDPLESIPPTPLFEVPVGLIALTAGVLAAAAVIGARAMQRRARRTSFAEVMRVADE